MPWPRFLDSNELQELPMNFGDLVALEVPGRGDPGG
jgi:hypothetical protein